MVLKDLVVSSKNKCVQVASVKVHLGHRLECDRKIYHAIHKTNI